MGKHIQEDSFYGKVGFNALVIGDSVIVPENTDAALKLIPGIGISLVIEDNQLVIDAITPVFEDKKW